MVTVTCWCSWRSTGSRRRKTPFSYTASRRLLIETFLLMRPHYTDFSVLFSSLPPIPAHRRDQLESLLRYIGRGAVSLERLEEDTNGDLVSRPERYEHDAALHRLQTSCSSRPCAWLREPTSPR